MRRGILECIKIQNKVCKKSADAEPCTRSQDLVANRKLAGSTLLLALRLQACFAEKFSIREQVARHIFFRG